jgi:hypothetical protein
MPLKTLVGTKKQLMDLQEVSLVFGLLAPIYTGSQEFLGKLSALMERWDPAATLLYAEDIACVRCFSLTCLRYAEDMCVASL